MSFGNTKTPTLREIKSNKTNYKPKYEVKRTGKYSAVVLTAEQEADLCKRYPTTPIRQLMTEYQLGFSWLHKFSREHGLTKDMKVIRKKLARHIVRVCEENGYYDSIRGIPPSPQCQEAAKRKRAEGFHPVKRLKEINPRKYKQYIKKKTEQWKEIRDTDKRKRAYGLDPTTRFHIPTYVFDWRQKNYRYYARKRGYIMGDMHEEKGERYTFYYTPETRRGKRFEENCNKAGFTIRQARI